MKERNTKLESENSKLRAIIYDMHAMLSDLSIGYPWNELHKSLASVERDMTTAGLLDESE